MIEPKYRMTSELVGVHCLNPGIRHNSPSRGQMLSSHLTSKVTIDYPEPALWQSGAEHEFGKSACAIRMPERGRIIAVIPMFQKTPGENSIDFNPETMVIYEATDTHQIDCFKIPYHTSFHQYFGFRNVPVHENLGRLWPGNSFNKGDIFAHTPGLGPYNNYMYGRNLNTAMMNLPATAEDGIIISSDVLHLFKFRIYETRTIGVGSTMYPRLIYNGRPFPEIGEYIREDGLLMMLRPYDNDLSPVDMGIYDMKSVDAQFDKPVYAREAQTNYNEKGEIVTIPGRVVSIEVVRNNETNRQLPHLLAEPFEKYNKAVKKYYNRIYSTYRTLLNEQRKKDREATLEISGALQELLVRAQAITNQKLPGVNIPLSLNVNQTPVDEYQITFTIEYEMTPNMGGKLTGRSGDKGTFCQIRKREDMPVDKNGVHAQIVVSPDSTAARTNLARLFEQHYNASSCATRQRIIDRLGYNPNIHNADEFVRQMPQAQFDETYDYVLGYYKALSNVMYGDAILYTPDERREDLTNLIKTELYNLRVIHEDKDPVEAAVELMENYPFLYDTVRYRGDDGEMCETADRVLIGKMYWMLLDKIADTWSAVSLGKLQHFGVPAPRTRGDRASLPFRETPVTGIGATEGRIFACYTGRRSIAEMMDRSNNPTTQLAISRSILAAEFPTNIPCNVDRSVIEYGSTRPLQLVKHAVASAGTDIAYISERDVPHTN